MFQKLEKGLSGPLSKGHILIWNTTYSFDLVICAMPALDIVLCQTYFLSPFLGSDLEASYFIISHWEGVDAKL